MNFFFFFDDVALFTVADMNVSVCYSAVQRTLAVPLIYNNDGNVDMNSMMMKWCMGTVEVYKTTA